MIYYIITLQSVHKTIKCEKVLQESGIIVEIIPTPAMDVVDCGVSLNIPDEHFERAREIIEECGAVKRVLKEHDGVLSNIE